jgi:hypothetical protein
MTALEQWLAELLIAHNVGMLRAEAEVKARVLAVLLAMQKNIVSILANAPEMSILGRADKNALLKESNQVIADFFAKAQLELNLAEVAKVEALGVQSALAKVVDLTPGAELPSNVAVREAINAMRATAAAAKNAEAIQAASLEVRIGVALPTDGYLEKLAGDVLIQGAPAKQWWARQVADTQFKLSNEIRIGAAQGETNAQIIKRIVGSEVTNVAGVMPLVRHNAAAIVQTAMAQVAAEARRASFQANRDLIRGIEQVSTMDSHTCFTAGHMVLMADGSEKPIEKICAGDMVIGGLTKQPRRVIATKKTAASTVDIWTNKGHTFRCTPEHLFMTDKGWVTAIDLKDQRVSAYVPKREALRGTICESGAPVAAALLGISGNERQDAQWRQSGGVGGDQEVRIGYGDDGDSRGVSVAGIGSGSREVVHQKPEHVLPTRLQHDGGRRGSSRPAGACAQGEWSETVGAAPERSRVCGQNAGCEQTRRVEGFGGPHEMVGNSAIGNIESAAVVTGSEGGGISAQCSQGTGNSSQDICWRGSELGIARVSPEGERGSRESTSGFACKRSAMGCEPKQGDVRINETQVARPGVCGKTEGGTVNTGSESKNAQGEPEEKDVHAGSKGGACREVAASASGELGRSSLPRENDGDYARVEGIKKVGKRVVYDIQVDAPDESFICNGVVVHNSPICIAYSGARWDMDYEPIDDNDLPYNGGVSRHFNCRSTEIALTKTFREMGIPMDEPAEGTRASSSGQISAKTTFPEYLTMMGQGYQDETLGKGRAELFRAGKMTTRDLVDMRGNPLKLSDLRAKYETH